MPSKLALAAALSSCLLAHAAIADEVSSEIDSDGRPVHLLELPDDCRQFALLPSGASDMSGWSQILSLASCMQDTSHFTIEKVAEISDQVDVLSRRMVPALAIYLDAVEHAPVQLQLAATYQIGLAQIAMITRARASVPTPKDFATNPRAAARHRKLQAEIDVRIAPMVKIAWMAFTMIDTVACENPELVTDPVMTANVAFSRRMLQIMPDPTGPPTVMAKL